MNPSWSLALALALLAPACAPPSPDDSAADTDTGEGNGGGGGSGGAVDPFRVATFNIDWLSPRTADPGDMRPRNATDHQMLRSLIEEFDLSLVGLQEIEGTAALDVLGFGPEWAYVAGSTGWSQNLALLYRADRLQVSDVAEIHLPANQGTSKDPLVATVRHIEGGATFLAVVVHMMPYEDEESAAYRYAQVEDLAAWLAEDVPARYPPQLVDNVLLLGDFNDTFAGLHPDWPSLSVLEDGSGGPAWRFATRQADGTSTLHYDSLIDHIALSPALAERWIEADAAEGCHVIFHDDIAPWSSYAGGYGGWQNISSHRPVSITLDGGALSD